ncbi:MAG: ABC transporter substrate-binding protein, partial [Rhodobacterales bacterium]
IIGPLFSESAVAVGKVAAANNVNVLSFSNTLEVAGGNIFILGNTFQNTADRIIGYASTKGYKSIAIVSPETSAGSIASSAVKSVAAKIG